MVNYNKYPYTWVVFHPLYTLNNQVGFFIAHFGWDLGRFWRSRSEEMSIGDRTEGAFEAVLSSLLKRRKETSQIPGVITLRSKQMAQIPKGSLVTGPHKPICRDCTLYILFKYCKWDPCFKGSNLMQIIW